MLDLSFGGAEFPRALEVRQFLYQNSLLGQTTRFRRLERLEAYYKCLEYAHQPYNWDGQPADNFETISPDVIVPQGFTQPGQELKVNQKRPTAPMRLTALVVDRFTDLIFSADRTPNVSVDDDSKSDDFLSAVFKKARFWRTMHMARTHGGSMGSVLVTAHLRNIRGKSRFSFAAHNPKTVMDVVWEDPDLKTVSGVLIQYLFSREVEQLDAKTGQPTGRTREATYLYRRIIDEEMDVTFKPAEVKGGQLPLLEVDLHNTYAHKLGRFPGVWIQNLPSDEELDGLPDCDGSYQMFDTIDRQVAQQNKGLLANMDPTLVISRDKKLAMMGVPIKKGSDNALDVGQGGSANYLEIGGAGINASQGFVGELKEAALQKTGMIVPAPEQMAGAAQSALAIEMLYHPTLAKASRLREQYGEAIEQLAEIVLEYGRKWGDPLQYEGNSVPEFDLGPRVIEEDADPNNPNPEEGSQKRFVKREPGKGSIVSLEWGPYFAPTPNDKQAKITNISMSFQAGLIDQETAVRKIAPILDIEDVEGLLRRVREEAEKKEQQQMGGLFGGGMGGEEMGEEMPPEGSEEMPLEEPPEEPPMM
jgi:hypothetical protein